MNQILMSAEDRMRRHLPEMDDTTWRRVSSRARQYFHDLPLKGRRVLDIGAGSGVFSLWMKEVCGAAEVVAVEPGEGVGTTAGVDEASHALFERSGIPGLRLVSARIQDFVPDEPFDVIVSINSINHVDEVTHRLDRESDARDRFITLFRQLHDMLVVGGDLMVTDADRYCLERYTARLGLPRLFTPTIDYDLHQKAETWAELAEMGGFGDFHIRGVASSSLEPRLGPWRDNRIAAFLTTGVFLMRARRIS
ncbi:MAG: class I SAM-dependent methyltransferase [Bradymonadia bacterium]